MNFDFSDDQKMLKDQAHKFLSEKCTTKNVRTVFEGKDHFDKALWKQIGEMGWTGTAIPENYGGLGLGYGFRLCCALFHGRAWYRSPRGAVNRSPFLDSRRAGRLQWSASGGRHGFS